MGVHYDNYNLHCVALRKESVDRNRACTMITITCIASLSARRAWIEIVISAMTSQISVSLSARRAWIEMFLSMGLDGRFKVALRKESVDRNRNSQYSYFLYYGRSPQGERG